MPRQARDSGHLCAHCGHPDRYHRSSDSQCPVSRQFPNPPRGMNSRDPETVKRASERWDKKIAAHWNTDTTFKPL